MGVAVLGYQVAGVAREHEIFDFPLSAFAKGDHFRDVQYMITVTGFRIYSLFFCT